MIHSLRIGTAVGFFGCVIMGFALPSCTNRLGPVRATQSIGGMGRPNLPDIVIQRSAECMEVYARQFEPGWVVLESTVEVNEDGDKVGVTMGGIPETAPDFGACLRNVLRDMPIAKVPLHEGVETLKFHLQHASDSREALNRFIQAIPGVPIVESELVLEVEAYTVVLPVTIKVVGKQVKQINLDKAILAKIGQMALDSVGYEEIMRQAEEQGWVKWVRVEQALSAADKMFIAKPPTPPNIDAIVNEAFKQVMTKTAPIALGVSQLDTPAPGPADLVAVGIFAVSLVAVGGIVVYDLVTAKDTQVATASAPAPASAAQPKASPAPPTPPPPPPPPKETCEANSELKKIIRCDDPRISHYKDESENKAFTSIKVKGSRKEESKTKATGGPCENRGGFHTKVKSGKDYIASIVGCFCCDDSSGKAVKSERTEIQFKP